MGLKISAMLVIAVLAVLSFGVIFAINSVAVAADGSNIEAKNLPSCGGNCRNPTCGAASGGSCDCQNCEFSAESCRGTCGESCTSASCGAKLGGSCGCSS